MGKKQGINRINHLFKRGEKMNEPITEPADVKISVQNVEKELDCFTETLLRKEWKSLVNHLMDDPAPADWIMDLVVSRCKEIQAQLRTIKN